MMVRRNPELTHVIRSVHTVVHTHKPVPHTPATRLTADGDAGRRRRESAHRSGHAHLKFDVLGLGGGSHACCHESNPVSGRAACKVDPIADGSTRHGEQLAQQRGSPHAKDLPHVLDPAQIEVRLRRRPTTLDVREATTQVAPVCDEKCRRKRQGERARHEEEIDLGGAVRQGDENRVEVGKDRARLVPRRGGHRRQAVRHGAAVDGNGGGR